MTDVPAAGSINAHVTPAAAAGIAVAAGDPRREEVELQDAWCAGASVQRRLQINASVIRTVPAAAAAASAAAAGARLLVT